MATANCLNDNCEHNWTLQKAPGEYKNGIRCPSCGSTNVDIESNTPSQNQEERVPDTQDQQRGQTPANTGGNIQFGEPSSMGDAAAQALVTATSDEVSTEQKVGTVKSVGSMVVDGAANLMSYREQINQQQEEHAKGVSIEKADDKPRCEECGYVFSQVPMSKDRLTCPDCGEEYLIRVE